MPEPRARASLRARRGLAFREWLRDDSGVDDEVRVGDGAWTRLSALLLERDGHVRLDADVLEMTFVAA